jgi:hypothetical protein
MSQEHVYAQNVEELFQRAGSLRDGRGAIEKVRTLAAWPFPFTADLRT